MKDIMLDLHCDLPSNTKHRSGMAKFRKSMRSATTAKGILDYLIQSQKEASAALDKDGYPLLSSMDEGCLPAQAYALNDTEERTKLRLSKLDDKTAVYTEREVGEMLLALHTQSTETELRLNLLYLHFVQAFQALTDINEDFSLKENGIDDLLLELFILQIISEREGAAPFEAVTLDEAVKLFQYATRKGEKLDKENASDLLFALHEANLVEIDYVLKEGNLLIDCLNLMELEAEGVLKEDDYETYFSVSPTGVLVLELLEDTKTFWMTKFLREGWIDSAKLESSVGKETGRKSTARRTKQKPAQP